MHNPGELASLCGSLCLGIDGTCREKKDRILAQITHQTEINHNPEKSYAEVLHFMWEDRTEFSDVVGLLSLLALEFEVLITVCYCRCF